MAERILRSGGLGCAAAVVATMVALLAPGPAAAASPTLYVGDSDEYAVAFKADGAGFDALELDGAIQCYFSEPREDLPGPAYFGVFPAPVTMRETPRGWVASESGGGNFGSWRARVVAGFTDAAATGTISFDQSDETFHCDTGYSGIPFEALRFEPIGSPGVAPPGTTGVYYGSRAPIEIFTRTSATRVVGLRGSFVPRCPVGRKRAIPERSPLLFRLGFARLDGSGRFRRHAQYSGRMPAGAAFRESVTLVGRVTEGALAGSYRRVRTTTRPHRPPRKCITGPLRFRAVRYLLVAPAGG